MPATNGKIFMNHNAKKPRVLVVEDETIVAMDIAQLLRDLGYDVSVVAAHPHYPAPQWGRRLRPYRETRDGIPVLRLPIWAGRGSAGERLPRVALVGDSQAAALLDYPNLEQSDADCELVAVLANEVA